jgi:hypothetical protein
MSVSSRGLVLVAALVTAASLAANAYLLLRPRAPPAAKTPVTSGDRAADPACGEELDTCRRTAQGLAVGLWRSSGNDAPRPEPSAAPPAPLPSPPPVKLTGDALCRLARDKLREQWLEQRESIASAIARDLPDKDKQRADARRDAQQASEALGVSGRERRAFEEDYVNLRQARMADLASYAVETPPDWPALLDGVRVMFDEEDALVARDLGPDAASRYRQSEREGRLTILSAAATYADVDWDEAMAGR